MKRPSHAFYPWIAVVLFLATLTNLYWGLDTSREIDPQATKQSLDRTANTSPKDSSSQSDQIEPSPNVEIQDGGQLELTYISYDNVTPFPDGIHWTRTVIGRNLPEELRIRIEYTYRGDPAEAGSMKIRRAAMVADQFLVQLSPDSSESELLSLARTANYGLVPISSELGLYAISLAKEAHPNDLPEAIDQFKNLNGIILFAEPDYLVSTSLTTPVDPQIHKQWGMQNIGAFQGWSTATSAANQIVAIIDSGVLDSHEDIGDNLWQNQADPINGIDDDNNGYIDDYIGIDALNHTGSPIDELGHGTAIAGIIGGVTNNSMGISGVAWDIQMMPLKFFGTDGTNGRTSDAIKCIDYAIANGANIINASWTGSSKSNALEQAIIRANDAGILFVAAAGNENRNIDSNPTYPASYSLPNVITVAATTRSNDIASFSNYGNSRVHIGAPGMGIYSMDSTSTDSYGYFNGTSFAAPFVSGVAALLREHFGTEEPQRLRDRIMRTSNKFPSLSSVLSSGGVLSLSKSLEEQSNAPDNDDFSNATTLTANAPFVYNSLEQATVKSGEPNPFNGALEGSTWYRIVAPYDAVISITVSSDLFLPQLAVFNGSSLETLTLENFAKPEENTATINLSVEKGKSTYIQVSGATGLGPYSLKYQLPPENDAYESAIDLPTDRFNIQGSNRFATSQTSEPVHGKRAIGLTTWWRFTANQTGLYLISTFGSDTDTIVAVYRGQEIDTLEFVAANDDFNASTIESSVQFEVSEDTEYYVVVDSATNEGGIFNLVGQYIDEPRFLTHPQNSTSVVGFTASMSGHAVGPPPIQYQWLKNGLPIPNEIQSELVFNPVNPSDFANYQLRATTSSGSITSNVATLSEGGNLPSIIFQPYRLTIETGQSKSLRIFADGSGPLNYQWYRNGTLIPGATQNEFAINQAEEGDSGSYELYVSNNLGTIVSDPISVRVGAKVDTFITWIYPLDQYDFVNALEGYQNRYYAGGKQGQILMSLDGITWTEIEDFGTDNQIHSLHSLGGKLIAVSDSGRIFILDSLQSEWRAYDFPSSSRVSDVEYIQGTFAILVENRLFTSPDCTNWTLSLSLPDVSGSLGLAYANRYLLAYKRLDELTNFYRSTNGLQWDSWSDNTIRYATSLEGLGDQFQILSSDGSFTSQNGIDWQQQPIINFIDEIFESNGTTYAKGGGTFFKKSQEGDWEEQFYSFRDLHFAYTNNGVVMGPYFGALLRFSDFGSIQVDGLVPEDPWHAEDYKFIGNRLIGYGGSRTGISSGNLDWTFIEETYRSIEYGNGTFVATTYRGVATGPSIMNLVDVAGTSDIVDILAYGNNTFIASGREGRYLSSDGKNWELLPPDFVGFQFLTYSLGKFIGINDDGSGFASTNGRDWTPENIRPPYPGNRFVSISGDNDILYALTEEGQLYSKTNEKDWSLITTLPAPETGFSSFEYGNGALVASSYYTLFYSEDAKSWTQYDTPSFYIEGVSFGKETFLAFGNNGELIEIGIQTSSPPKIFPNNLASNVFRQPNESIDLQVDAFDLDGSITNVQFLLDGEILGESALPPFKVSFTPTVAGIYNLKITATDNEGITTEFISKINVQSSGSKDLLELSQPQGVDDLVYQFGSIYVLSSSGNIYRTNDFENWILVFEPTFSKPIALHKVDGAIVAAALGEVSYRTENGFEWNVISIPGTNLGFIRQAGEWLVAEDKDLDPIHLRSKDGLVWQSYLGGAFLASNHQWAILDTEEDGVISVVDSIGSIQTFDLPVNGIVRRAFSHHGIFYITVTPGGNPANRVVVSTSNFLEWEILATPQELEGITQFYAENGVYYVASNYESFVSVDLENWIPFPDHQVSAIEYSDGEYIAFANSKIYYSRDGIDWNIAASGIGDRFLATPLGFLSWEEEWGNSLWVSQRGFNWDKLTPNNKGNTFKDIAYGNGIYVAIGAQDISVAPDQIYLAISSDGIHFELYDKPDILGDSIVYGNGTFYARTNESKLGVSTDGVNWTFVDFPSSGLNSNGAIFFPPAEGLVMPTLFNFYLFSKDGINWENRSHSNEDHEAFNHVGNLIFAKIGHPDIYVTSDAMNWTHVEKITTSTEIVFWDGYYYGIGNAGTLVKSADGLNWETLPGPSLDRIEFIEPREDGFLVSTGIMNGYEHFHSPDGLSWIKQLGYESPGTPELANGHVFFLQKSLSRQTFDDLSLAALTVTPGEYSVGSNVTGTISLQNNSDKSVSFNSLELSARLGKRQIWLDQEGLVLPDYDIGPGTIGFGETKDFSFTFELPNGIDPGIFGLNVGINLNQTIPEFIFSNNYDWSGDGVITIPERHLEIGESFGGDVIALSNQKSFASGTTISLIASPYRGFSVSGWKGVDSSIIESASVTLNSDRTISATFTQSFSSWIANFFPVSEIENSIKTGIDGDPDKDTYTNIAEYWFGTDPTDSRSIPRFSLSSDSGFFVLKVTRPKTGQEYVLNVRNSGDIRSWNQDSIQAEVVDESDLSETLSFKTLLQTGKPVFFQLTIDPYNSSQ